MNSLKQHTILLVEDESIVAMSESMILENNGYRVITAGNGETAVRIMEGDADIDLILMDINLGNGIDGTQAAEIIQKKHNIPVIFLSSHTEPDIVEKTEGITSYGYIVKYCGDTILLASIKMAFKLFESRVKALESETRLRFIYENTDDVIWVLDLKTGKFTYVSPSVQKLRGYTPEEVINQTIAEALTQESYLKVTDMLAMGMADRKPGDTKSDKSITRVDQPCKDGSIVSTEVSTTIIFDEHGQPAEVIGISRNISHRADHY
jgi:PAS domain S-box-containing protein